MAKAINLVIFGAQKYLVSLIILRIIIQNRNHNEMSYRKIFISFFTLSIIVALISGCATDRLITRNNHDDAMLQCWQNLADATGDTVSLNGDLDKEIFQYQELIEEVLVARERALKITAWVHDTDNQDVAIPPAMLDKLNKGMTRGLELSDRVVAVVARNECWLQATEEKTTAKGIEPLDQYTRYKGFMLALSASLILYDTYLTTVTILNKDDRVRRFLNQSDLGYNKQKDQLEAVTDSIFNVSNVFLVQEEIYFFEDRYPGYVSKLNADPNAGYLSTLIQQSSSYALIRNATLENIKEQKHIYGNSDVEDSIFNINRAAFNRVSAFFGNIVGLVEERKGKLYNDAATHAHIESTLKAGDILLEKTPFRLTDKMIPGHWGHAAIWVGTEKELQELGIWDHPIVIKYHKQIISSQGVVEALRSDVEMNSLAHFMNIDDIAIIRDPARTDAETARRIIRTLRQVGKEYDFNYDVETTDKIVCSQLVYLAYTDIEWPTSKVIGRYTISPDNVAFKATNSGPLELVVFYHDGRLIKNQPVALMEKLMSHNK